MTGTSKIKQDKAQGAYRLKKKSVCELLSLFCSRGEVKRCENPGTSDTLEMARSGKSFIELGAFSQIIERQTFW